MASLEQQLTEFAQGESSWRAVVLFGSRVRSHGAVNQADGWSDVDVQIVTRDPELFSSAAWLQQVTPDPVYAYCVRRASAGVRKATGVLASGDEIDAVIVTVGQLRLARLLLAAGFGHRIPRLRRSLDELAWIMRPGFRLLKGGTGWESFYQRVVREFRGTRLDDEEARQLAQEFLCELVWVLRKLSRGEWVASQRCIQRSLVEINLRLLHEVRLRRGEVSFREGRRVEMILPPSEWASIALFTAPESASLQTAVRQAFATMNGLMTALLGASWKPAPWPAFAEGTHAR